MARLSYAISLCLYERRACWQCVSWIGEASFKTGKMYHLELTRRKPETHVDESTVLPSGSHVVLGRGAHLSTASKRMHTQLYISTFFLFCEGLYTKAVLRENLRWSGSGEKTDIKGTRRLSAWREQAERQAKATVLPFGIYTVEYRRIRDLPLGLK